jgi:hypothetical protein
MSREATAKGSRVMSIARVAALHKKSEYSPAKQDD